MSIKDQPNGRVQWLLWVNTLLTALILPVLGFVGIRLWDHVDANARHIASMQVQVEIVKERQNRVLETLPKLIDSDEDIRRLIDEHLKDVTLRKTLP